MQKRPTSATRLAMATATNARGRRRDTGQAVVLSISRMMRTIKVASARIPDVHGSGTETAAAAAAAVVVAGAATAEAAAVAAKGLGLPDPWRRRA